MKRYLITVILLFIAVLAGTARTARAEYSCTNPNTNCFNDGDCGGVGGWCQNRICKCGSPAPPICGDRCANLPQCIQGAGSCGIHSVVINGTTVHVTDCRGISSGAQGGVISYCTQAIDNSPFGSFDGADCNVAAGWAFDPDYAGSITVSIYRDGPAGAGGTLAASLTANQSRPDVGAIYPGHTNSGWSWAIPAGLKNGVAHSLYAYATDVTSSGVATGYNVLLGGSPKSITCNTPPTGAFTNAVCAFPSVTATGNATDPQGSPVNVTIYDGQAGAGGVQVGAGNATPNFSILFPAFLDGNVHTLYAYGKDIPTGVWYQVGTHTATCASPPVATISAVTRPNYCISGPSATVAWTYTSGPGLAQSAWQMQVANDNGFTSLVIPGAKTPGANTSTGTGQGILAYGKTYWTRVMVWDSMNTPSAWSLPVSFSTPSAAYPKVNFSMTPAQPRINQQVTFTDTSNYGTGVPQKRIWTFGDGFTVTELPGTGSIQHTYVVDPAGLRVSLGVNASQMLPADVCSSTSAGFAAQKAIPQFREVRP